MGKGSVDTIGSDKVGINGDSKVTAKLGLQGVSHSSPFSLDLSNYSNLIIVISTFIFQDTTVSFSFNGYVFETGYNNYLGSPFIVEMENNNGVASFKSNGNSFGSCPANNVLITANSVYSSLCRVSFYKI